jgi:hypothetical protein
MLITVTIGQLFLLITCGVVIVIFVYMLQTLKKLSNTVTDGSGLFTRNEKQISRIILHVEEISLNAEEISLILCGKGSYPVEKPDLHRQSLLHELENMKLAYREVAGSANKFRKTVQKLRR